MTDHVFEIELPSGEILEIEAPAKTPVEKIKARAQQYVTERSPQGVYARMRAGDPVAATEFRERYKAATGEDYVPESGVNPNAYTGLDSNFMASTGSTLGDTANGVMQYLIEGGPAGNVVASGMEAAGLPAPQNPMRDWIQQRIEEKRAADTPMREAEGGTAGAIAGNLLQLATPGAAAKLTSFKAPVTAKIATGAMPTTYKGNALLGAGFGAIQPRAKGESQAINTATGAASGVVGRGIAGRINAAAGGLSAKLKPETLEMYYKAKAAGIPVHWSQLTDSRFAKNLATTLGNLPFSGAGKAAKSQKDKFVSAVGETFGVKGATNLDDSIMSDAKKAISMEYEDVYSRNNIVPDAKMFSELGQLRNKANQDLTQDNARIAINQIDKIVKNLKSGGMTGKKYQDLRGDLGDIINNNQGTSLGGLIKQARKTLDATAERSVGPNDAAALKEANRKWANFRLTEKMLKQVEGAKGSINPANVWNQVKNGSTKEMRELGQVGQFLKDPIPDSGTAGRLLSGGAVVGGAASGGSLGSIARLTAGLGAGATAGRMLNSPRFGKYMAEGLGAGAKNLAENAGSLAKLTSVGSSPRASGALNGAARSEYIMLAANERPERGPEILSNLPPAEQAKAAEKFASTYGLNANEVLRRIQAEYARVNALMQ